MRIPRYLTRVLVRLLVATSFLMAQQPPVLAATTTFSTAGAYTYTVPAGVTRLQVLVAGAGGGGGGYDNAVAGAGGGGALVTLVIDVTPGQVISGTVAGGGATGWTAGTSLGNACNGGGNGGAGLNAGGRGGFANCLTAAGYSGGGGGGGGSTSLVLAGTNLAQAGGGGGGGGSTNGGVGGAGGTSATLATAASCSSVAPGLQGNNWTGDGGGGGGGGGGYAAGAAGNAAIDGATPTGGGAGTSCRSTIAAVVSASIVAGGGGAGAPGRTATATTSNGNGNSGYVTIATQPSLQMTVVSMGGISSFPFTGSNGWTTQTIVTTTAGVAVTGARQSFAAPSLATTITQSIPPGFALASVTCTGMGPGGTATVNTTTGAISFNAAALAFGADISCTATNTALAPSISLQKAVGGTGRVAVSDQFALQVTGTGAPAAVITTGAGTAVTSAALTFNATAGASYLLNEAMAAGSASPLSAYVRTMACSNAHSAGTNVTGTSSVPLTLTPAAGDVISCTITNNPAKPTLTIQKTASTPGPVSVGQTIIYTYIVANTGNVTINNVQVGDLHGTPGVLVPLGASGITNETLSVPGPAGAAASPDATPNNGIWSTLAPGASVTYQYTHTVTQAEIDNG